MVCTSFLLEWTEFRLYICSWNFILFWKILIIGEVNKCISQVFSRKGGLRWL